MPHISVIIPVYNAEGCLDELYRRLTASLESITEDFEVILVEDCGGDKSWDLISDLAKRDNRIKGIQFSRNFGQHYGITAGLDYCTGEWIIVMDCDLQDRPEEIPRLYSKIKEGYDVVLATRTQRKDTFFKKAFSKLFYMVFNYFSGLNYDGQTGNFRIISKKVVDNLRLMREQLRFFGGLITWMGFKTTNIAVEHSERFAGKTSYTFRKLLKLAIEVIIAYSDKPLRLSIKLGFLMSCIAFLYGAYILIRALFYGSAIIGWSSIIVSIFFIGGINIAILGIMGVYIGKIFDETKKRPLYIIGRTTFDEK